MNNEKSSRRDFLAATGTMAGASWLALNAPVLLAAGEAASRRRDDRAEWQNLSRYEAEMLAAIVDQIIPPDDMPGAADTGVVYFIDGVLGGFMAGAAAMLKAGLEDLGHRVYANYPDADSFPELGFEQQKGLLETVEQTPFFQTMIFLTHCGMFAMPSRGGNAEMQGWKLLGFENRFAWQPPFGYYDAQAAEEAEHGNG